MRRVRVRRPCGPTSGHVARVVDGDTIELATGEKIRYLMVDTPESTTELECYGENAKQFNTHLVGDKDIELFYDVECEDRFDHLLAYVTVNGVEVNTLIVERGGGCVLHIPPNGDDRADEFDALEDAAKARARAEVLDCRASAASWYRLRDMRWIIVLSLAAACASSRNQPGSDLVSELTAIKAEMCACKDDACGQRVKAKFDELEQRGAQRYGSVEQLPADVRARLTALDGEMRECMRKLAPPN